MKTIVIYYSVSGQTELVANRIAQKLGSDILEIETEVEIASDIVSRYFHGSKSMLAKKLPKLKAYTFNPNDYDNIIIGFPNWASNCPPAMKAFIADNRIIGKNLYLFTTYVARGGTKCLDNVAEMLSENSLKNTEKFSLPSKKNETELDAVIERFCSI